MEELLASYVIELDARTKKNSHRIAGSGARCPACGKFYRQFVRNASTTTKFAFDAAHFLQPKPKAPISGEIHLVYKFYMKTQRRVDDLNLEGNIDDILTKNGILEDDNAKIIRSRDGTRVYWDKDRPRIEIYIYRFEGEEETK